MANKAAVDMQSFFRRVLIQKSIYTYIAKVRTLQQQKQAWYI